MFSNGSNQIVNAVPSNTFAVAGDPAVPAGHFVPRQVETLDSAAAAMNHALEGDKCRFAGQIDEALAYYTEAVALQPEDARFHYLRAVMESATGASDACGLSLQAAVRLSPEFAQAQGSLAYWYLTQGMVEQARASSDRAIALAPEDAEVLESRAFVLEAAGETDEVWEIVQGLIRRGHGTPGTVSVFARLAAKRGHRGTALDLIRRLLDTSDVMSDQAILRFTAAGVLDSLGRYDEAFSQADYANRIGRRPYVPELHEATIDRLISYHTRERLQSLSRATYVSEAPVFIVGMPRSGTTLVEQILASHPAVHGAGELDFMHRVHWGTVGMLKAADQEYPDCLDRLTVDQANGMAQIYLEPLIALNPAAARITDKMPLNFLHLDLIQLLLPKARVIHCRRSPLDTCLSCFMMPFGTGNDFKFDLDHLGRFHRLSERLMAHWKKVLDLPILDVQYEDVVADQAGQARRMVEFLGLKWSDRCLRFHENKRAVATASMQQVRVPIYQSSMERWRHYEKHLGPLKSALGMAG